MDIPSTQPRNGRKEGLPYRGLGMKVFTMSERHDPPDPADSVTSTGVTGAPSWIEQAEGLRFPLAFIYGLSVAGAIGVLTPIPAVIAVVLAVQAVRRRVPHAYVALGVALIATAVGTWLMFSNPFMKTGVDGL
jgi:hypothetical protein